MAWIVAVKIKRKVTLFEFPTCKQAKAFTRELQKTVPKADWAISQYSKRLKKK